MCDCLSCKNEFTPTLITIIAPPIKVFGGGIWSKNIHPQIGAKILSTTIKSPTCAGIIYFAPLAIRTLEIGVMKTPRAITQSRAY